MKRSSTCKSCIWIAVSVASSRLWTKTKGSFAGISSGGGCSSGGSSSTGISGSIRRSVSIGRSGGCSSLVTQLNWTQRTVRSRRRRQWNLK